MNAAPAKLRRCFQFFPRKLLIVVTLAAVGYADQGKSASDPSADESIRTICPGLERLPPPEDPNGPGIDNHRWPEIVLLVEMIKVPENADDGRLRERERCNVKRVLYGTYAEKTVSFEWPGERTSGTGEFVVDFIPTFYKEQEDFTAQYCVPGVLDALKHAVDHCITYERKPATLLLAVNFAS